MLTVCFELKSVGGVAVTVRVCVRVDRNIVLRSVDLRACYVIERKIEQGSICEKSSIPRSICTRKFQQQQ